MFKKGLPHTVALSTQINSRNNNTHLTILLIILFVGVFLVFPEGVVNEPIYFIQTNTQQQVPTALFSFAAYQNS